MKLDEAIASVSKDNQERYIRAFSPEAIFTLLKYIKASRELVEAVKKYEYSAEDDETWEEYQSYSFRACCPCCGVFPEDHHVNGCKGERMFNALANIKKLEG